MQVGGCLRETFEFGRCERREQRNCPDIVNRQHGSVESKKGVRKLITSRRMMKGRFLRNSLLPISCPGASTIFFPISSEYAFTPS